MKYQRISAFYNETKLPQTFMDIGLYFSADKIVILATCRMKLCSITADKGPSIAEIQLSFIRET